MSGIGLTRRTADRLVRMLNRREGDTWLPRGGASTRSGVFVLCKSAEPASSEGIGVECYSGKILDPEADEATGDFEKIGDAWLTVLGPDGTDPVVPTVGSVYQCQLLGEVEAADGDERPRAVAVTGGPGGSGGVCVDLVHVVAGENWPDDPDDWFCRRVVRNDLGQLEEDFPLVEYGLGLVDGDGTGWVWEGSNLEPRVVDPDDDSTPTHAIPLFQFAGEPDEDGPHYSIDWPNWDSTATLEVLTGVGVSQNPETCEYTVTETLTSYDWRVQFNNTTALGISITPTPPPPPPPPPP